MLATCVTERGTTCLSAKSRAETAAVKTAAFTAAHYTVAAVIPSSQHPTIRAGAAAHDSSMTKQHFKFLVALMTKFGHACTKSRDRALHVVMFHSSAGIMMVLQDSFAEKKLCPRRSIMIQLGTGYCIFYALLDIDLIKFCDSVSYHIYSKRKRKQQI